MAKEQKSNTMVRDALILCVITLLAGLLVAFFYELTKDPIAANEQKAKNRAYRSIYADAAEFDAEPELPGGMDAAAAGEAAIEASGEDFGNITVDEIVTAADASGNFLGYIVSVTTGDGYGGDISISVGVNPDGGVSGVEILSIGETAGLGMKAKEASFRGQYTGKTTELFTVTKNEPAAEGEIQALSGATITSRAMTNAVNAALTTARSIMGE